MVTLDTSIFSRGCPKNRLDAHMRLSARLLILTGLILAGCGTARDVAVNSFRVLDAPANFVRRRLDSPVTTTTTTTVETARVSDVSTPGRPVTAPPPATINRRPVRTTASSPTARTKPAPSATPRPKPTHTTQFPTAKPVPGKPGYVYSIDPKGGIVDVTGYKPGDKAKDPYTQQIFIVP